MGEFRPHSRGEKKGKEKKKKNTVKIFILQDLSLKIIYSKNIYLQECYCKGENNIVKI